MQLLSKNPIIFGIILTIPFLALMLLGVIIDALNIELPITLTNPLGRLIVSLIVLFLMQVIPAMLMGYLYGKKFDEVISSRFRLKTAITSALLTGILVMLITLPLDMLRVIATIIQALLAAYICLKWGNSIYFYRKHHK